MATRDNIDPGRGFRREMVPIEPDLDDLLESMQGCVALTGADNCLPELGEFGIDDPYRALANSEGQFEQEALRSISRKSQSRGGGHFHSGLRIPQVIEAHSFHVWSRKSGGAATCHGRRIPKGAPHDQDEGLSGHKLFGDPAPRIERCEASKGTAVWLRDYVTHFLREAHAASSSNDCSAVTQSELDILRRLAEGKRLDQAASEIGLSIHVAAALLGSVLRKLQAQNVSHAVAKAMRAGLL